MKMTAIILAAGKGERLWPLTKYRPKPLIDLGDGTTILERQLSTLLKFDEVRDVIIVIGYKGEMIEEKITEMGLNDIVTTVYNPFYQEYNNLVSLWLALMKLGQVDGVLITNGDNLFKESLLKKLFDKAEEGTFLAVDVKSEYDSDDMKVEIEDNKIIQVSKNIPPEKISAESVGISLILDDKYINTIKSIVEYLIRREEFLRRFWLEIFNELSRRGQHAIPIFVEPNEWAEMDIHSDRELIKLLLESYKAKL